MSLKESEWTRLCCSKLTAAGAIVIAHVAGKMQSNHLPDRTIVTKYGNFFVEFKGTRTKWRDGQRILANQLNSRWPCCFLYRMPETLSIGNQMAYVDCLKDPKGFIQVLYELMVKQLEESKVAYHEVGRPIVPSTGENTGFNT